MEPFDFSSFVRKHPLHNPKNKTVICVFRIEPAETATINKFVVVRSKSFPHTCYEMNYTRVWNKNDGDEEKT